MVFGKYVLWLCESRNRKRGNSKFDSQFGYEEIDIKNIEEISAEEILNEVVK